TARSEVKLRLGIPTIAGMHGSTLLPQGPPRRPDRRTDAARTGRSAPRAPHKRSRTRFSLSRPALLTRIQGSVKNPQPLDAAGIGILWSNSCTRGASYGPVGSIGGLTPSINGNK